MIINGKVKNRTVTISGGVFPDGESILRHVRKEVNYFTGSSHRVDRLEQA